MAENTVNMDIEPDRIQDPRAGAEDQEINAAEAENRKLAPEFENHEDNITDGTKQKTQVRHDITINEEDYEYEDIALDD